jgi:hypothetical protein
MLGWHGTVARCMRGGMAQEWRFKQKNLLSFE